MWGYEGEKKLRNYLIILKSQKRKYFIYIQFSKPQSDNNWQANMNEGCCASLNPKRLHKEEKAIRHFNKTSDC